ncbi:MAG: copper-translocating P-type ATPase [Candidatus Yanofskybacteria bacterium]|nr:copper-translocating P-type ATPase [Candidatus Yanofskybacteria bacterium]
MNRSSLYTCPMHPEVQREAPGMCPECGMALIPSPEKTGHNGHAEKKELNKHAGHSTEMFLRKFWVSLAATIPILAYSELPDLFFGWQAPQFLGYQYMMLAFGSFVFFYGGSVFLRGAFRELRVKLPGMMTLIALAVTAAYLWSVYAVFVAEHPLFWELGTLITIMLLGHWLEMKAVQGARGALQELAKLLPDTAEVIQKDKSKSKTETKIVPVAELQVGDIVLVKPGGKIPADGRVLEGQSDLNESIVTGESRLVLKKPGDEVIAGTVNGDGSLKVEVAKIGEDTFLAGVMRLAREAAASKSRLQLLSDRAALYLTVIAVVAGIITLAAWLATGAETAFAVARLVAVLVIACPHALGLAVPLVASISTNMAASSGFLVKQRLALEAARKVDIVLFDKTGTLTKGEFSVVGVSDSETLRLAASVNVYSEHPIASAVVRKAREENLQVGKAVEFQRVPGVGVKAKIEGKEVFVGHKGGNDIVVEVDGKAIGAISVADTVRPESKEAVDALHEQGITVAMITGDAEKVAKEVAEYLGIDEYFARVLPGQKAEKVKELQSRGLKVAMVGDGVNDAPALSQADLGVAIGAGTNAAIESAGIILVKNDPRDIPKIIRLSQMTFAKMIQNLFWATGYNIVALPLAAGVLITRGIVLEPALAAVLMSASTVIVAVNALLLRREKL